MPLNHPIPRLIDIPLSSRHPLLLYISLFSCESSEDVTFWLYAERLSVQSGLLRASDLQSQRRRSDLEYIRVSKSCLWLLEDNGCKATIFWVNTTFGVLYKHLICWFLAHTCYLHDFITSIWARPPLCVRSLSRKSLPTENGLIIQARLFDCMGEKHMLCLTTGGSLEPEQPGWNSWRSQCTRRAFPGKSRAGNNLTIIKAYKLCQAAIRPNGLQPISYDINGIRAS